MRFKIGVNLFKTVRGWVLVSDDNVKEDDYFYHTESGLHKCIGINKHSDIEFYNGMFKTSYPNKPTKNQYIKKVIGTVGFTLENIPSVDVKINNISHLSVDAIIQIIDDKMCRWSSDESEYYEYKAYLLGLKDGVEFMTRPQLGDISEVDVTFKYKDEYGFWYPLPEYAKLDCKLRIILNDVTWKEIE